MPFPGNEAGRATEPSAHEVIGQPGRRDPHQRLRHEDAPGVEAEDPRRERLHPEGERRLVDCHQAAGIERGDGVVVAAEELRDVLLEARALGVKNILALRGDPPAGQAYRPHPGGYAFASDLVAATRPPRSGFRGPRMASRTAKRHLRS